MCSITRATRRFARPRATATSASAWHYRCYSASTSGAGAPGLCGLCPGEPCPVQHGHGRGDETRNVARGCWHDERIRSLRQVRKRFHVLLRHLEVRRFHAALVANGVGYRANAGGGRLGDDSYGGRLALSPVDRRLLLALGPEYRGLLLAIGDVDLLLSLALGFCDERAFFPLGGDLLLHRAQDRFGGRQAFDLVAQHLDSPVSARLVERGDDLPVDLVARLERLVELHLADLAAQRGLRQLRDRRDVVG